MTGIFTIKTLAARARMGRLLLGACVALTATGLTVAGLAVAAVPGPSLPPAMPAAIAAAVQPAAAPVWVAVTRPLEIFSLSAPNLSVSSSYSAERLSGGKGRRDTLRLGALDSEDTFVAIAVTREASAAPTLAGTARRLSDGKGGTLLDQTSIATKFGAFDAAPVTVAGSRNCLAFAHLDASAGLAIEGLYCLGKGEEAKKRTVACTVDRLDLLGGGSDLALRRAFVEAEKRRDFCGSGDLRGGKTARADAPSGGTAVPIQRRAS
jgi:hypothetical protein